MLLLTYVFFSHTPVCVKDYIVLFQHLIFESVLGMILRQKDLTFWVQPDPSTYHKMDFVCRELGQVMTSGQEALEGVSFSNITYCTQETYFSLPFPYFTLLHGVTSVLNQEARYS